MWVATAWKGRPSRVGAAWLLTAPAAGPAYTATVHDVDVTDAGAGESGVSGVRNTSGSQLGDHYISA